MCIYKNKIKLLHIYGQDFWHTCGYIVGNKEALIALKNAIEIALDEGEGVVDVYVNDGEGYDVHVIRDNSDWKYKAVPYTDEVAREKNKKAIWPWNKQSGKE